MERARRMIGAAAVAVALLVAAPLAAMDLASFESRVTTQTLDNGLTVLVYERPGVPVVSFFTYADVGSAQEVPGITGLAHMFEHMAFKGTSTIGTSNWTEESLALAKVDQAYHAYDLERRKPGGPDQATLTELEKAWRDAQEEAGKFVVSNEYDDIIERAGGAGVNAGTGADSTAYFYSLPANKVELWAYMESSRFFDPVFREFYKERDVVMEERRLRVESQPIGRLIEQFLSTAFSAHPYHHPVIGYMSDLESFSREDAEKFFHTYYVPANLTIAIAGDVKASTVIPVVDEYFSRLPKAPKPQPLRTVEPDQNSERIVEIPDPSQPIYLEGYHRPSGSSPDDAIYDAMTSVLSEGRTSRLYRSLVRDKKIAAMAGAFSGLPGTKYPNLVIFFAVPSPGHTNDEVQAAIREEIGKITSEPVTDEELSKVKNQAKADLIRGLQSNQGIAGQLATYQALDGDWRELFRSVDKIDAVTKDDILRVAKKTFVPTNRTVGMIVHEIDNPAGKK